MNETRTWTLKKQNSSACCHTYQNVNRNEASYCWTNYNSVSSGAPNNVALPFSRSSWAFNFFESCGNLLIILWALDLDLNNSVSVEELSADSCTRKFDVLKTNICPSKYASFKNIKFLRGNSSDSSETKTLYCLYCSKLSFLPHGGSKIN